MLRACFWWIWRKEGNADEVRPKYMVDCPAVDCSGWSSEEIAEELLSLSGDIKDKIVRINLRGVNRAAYRNINQSRLNRIGAQALHLKIRVEYDDVEERSARPVDSLRLHEEFARFLED